MSGFDGYRKNIKTYKHKLLPLDLGGKGPLYIYINLIILSLYLVSLELQWFPNSIGTRHFTTVCEIGGTSLPLSSLVTPLTLPEETQNTSQLFHLIGSVSYTVTNKQLAFGTFGKDGWSAPSHTLLTRRGNVASHAVLLCCALQGQRKDAFVCKGIHIYIYLYIFIHADAHTSQVSVCSIHTHTLSEIVETPFSISTLTISESSIA
eukprot:GHVR01094925.1.p1 GENE.GHVR01094925.1~~GHVR01094925.1.p1  ORF type:complete len:206 (-),score=36.04 GHVR01094925.1:4-621(-)